VAEAAVGELVEQLGQEELESELGSEPESGLEDEIRTFEMQLVSKAT